MTFCQDKVGIRGRVRDGVRIRYEDRDIVRVKISIRIMTFSQVCEFCCPMLVNEIVV
jgi:hypothetical protein